MTFPKVQEQSLLLDRQWPSVTRSSQLAALQREAPASCLGALCIRGVLADWHIIPDLQPAASSFSPDRLFSYRFLQAGK
ncbi:hypothetical protein WJX72_009046 [[Myrmecia] bisecta]|uniref:Uncharacterized protein n=1 Tax=[Myrmecia] bisecta TaxID=41462 RepID=A0AAW1PHV3_9CHLO